MILLIKTTGVGNSQQKIFIVLNNSTTFFLVERCSYLAKVFCFVLPFFFNFGFINNICLDAFSSPLNKEKDWRLSRKQYLQIIRLELKSGCDCLKRGLLFFIVGEKVFF